MATHLGMPMRLVRADRQDLLAVLPAAVLNGQNWRDFNVHAAVVNEIPGAAVAEDHPHGALVFTGDLMNEFLADHTPVTYVDSPYQRLSHLPSERLRIPLTRGVQTGDREVGVFTANGLTVVQPYGWAAAELLSLPEPVSESRLMEHLAHHWLPRGTLRRPKVRAQIGDTSADTGVLPQLLQAGVTQARLQHLFGVPISDTDLFDPRFATVNGMAELITQQPLPEQRHSHWAPPVT